MRLYQHMKFWFFFASTAERERILSVKQRDVVVQPFSLYLEIIVIFLQTFGLSLSWTMRSVNLTAVLPRCFLIQLSCCFFAVSTKTCNSMISLQSLLYHLILNFVSIPLTANNLLWCLLRKYFSSDEVFNWWYCLFSKLSWCDFKTSSSFNIRISCRCT